MSYHLMYKITWALLAGSLVVAAPLVLMRIQDHANLEEDLQFSKQTAEDVKSEAAEPKGEELA